MGPQGRRGKPQAPWGGAAPSKGGEALRGAPPPRGQPGSELKLLGAATQRECVRRVEIESASRRPGPGARGRARNRWGRWCHLWPGLEIAGPALEALARSTLWARPRNLLGPATTSVVLCLTL